MKRILYVIHSGTSGGTYLTNKDLMNNVEEFYEVFLLAAEDNYFGLYQCYNEKLTLLKKFSRKSNWSAKVFHDSWLNYIYFEILTEYQIDIIHIRHLINHSLDLPQLAKKLNIPVVLSFHDFYCVCPFYVLIDEDYNYCAGNCKNNSFNCFNPWDSILGDIHSKDIILDWRKNMVDLFKNVDYFITTSQIVKDIFMSIYDVIDDEKFKVIEHGRDFPKLDKQYYQIPSKDEPIKILCPANHLNILKGSDVFKKVKEYDKENRLEFHFLGNCHDGLENYGICHGTFERDEFYKIVDEIKPSFTAIFSIWPETFCHTITESWSCGIPIFGSNIGVVGDRIKTHNGGWLVDIRNPKEIYDTILNVVEDKESYISIQNNIQNMDFKTTKMMANKYLEIYNSL